MKLEKFLSLPKKQLFCIIMRCHVWKLEEKRKFKEMRLEHNNVGLIVHINLIGS